MLKLNVEIPKYIVNILNTNNKIGVEFAKEMLIKSNYKIELVGKLPVFNIGGKKYLVRTTKGSSSEKGIGRERIKDSEFYGKFDKYLIPSFSETEIQFKEISK